MKRIMFPLLAGLTAYAVYAPIPAAAARIKNFARRPRGKSLPGADKTLFLTFDDGPDGNYTPALLDLLSENGIRASFFMVADFAAKNPGIVQRAAEEGHLIGLHSSRHDCALFTGPRRTRDDIDSAFKIMGDLGVDVRYYRAPWGLVNLTMQRKLAGMGVHTVFWDVMAEDWRGNTTADAIAEKLRRRAKDGSILCLHDGRGKNSAPARTISALRMVLPQWKKEGCRFLRIDER